MRIGLASCFKYLIVNAITIIQIIRISNNNFIFNQNATLCDRNYEFIIPEKIYNLKDLYPETKNLHGEELVLKLKDLDKGVKVWYNHMVETEKEYKFLTLDCGWAAQDARDILPNATSTILNVCMFNEDWKHFFDLRALGTTGKPHPDMKRIAMKVYENF